MNILIGDIGNTITKVCLIDIHSFVFKKIVYFNSNKILSKKFLKNKLNKTFKKSKIHKFALFSSVVPKFESEVKAILKKHYKIKLIEIKKKKLTK